MRKFLLALVLAILVSFCAGNEAEGEMPETSPNMLVLDDSSIAGAIKSNKKILIEFYAPWCGYCQAFAQAYENVADRVAADPNLDVVVAKIDGDANPQSMNTHKAEYFPTLLFFEDGQAVQYQGNLEEADVIHFLETGENPQGGGMDEGQEEQQQESQLETPVKLNTDKELEDVVQAATVERPCLIGFVPAELEEDYLKLMKDAGFVGVSYKYVTDKKLAETIIEQFPAFALFVDGDVKAQLKFEDATKLPEASGLWKFFRASRFPAIGPITMKNIEDYWRSEAEDNIATVYVVTAETQPKLNTLLEELAKASEKKVYIGLLNEEDEVFKSMLSEMGLKKESMMMTVGANTQYNFDGDLKDEAAVKKFFDDYNAGNLKQYTKSQPIPEKNDGPVYVIVADSFDDVVGKDKDVLVEFYAPWCGHCQELEPKYVKVGEAFKGVDGLVIAKMDADGNTPPPQIQGFPTLLFYPKGSTEPVEYQGDLEAKNIAEFVKKQSTANTDKVKHDEL